MKWLLIPVLYILSAVSVWAEDTPSVQVYAAQVQEVPFFDTIEALGTLQANEQVSLAATVTEVVTAVDFEDNQRVKKGDLLVQMDVAEERAELAEEEARLESAKRQLKRLEPLASKGATSATALDESRVAVETAKARIQAINARIALRRITAPFDGVVGLRHVSVGALVKSDSIITTIDDDSVMKLDFTLPSIYLEFLKPGIKISATSRAFESRRFEGVVSAIGSRIDPVTRAITVRARIANPKRLLKPGLLMHVVMPMNPRKSLLIPESCLLSRGAITYVFLIINHEGKHVIQKRDIVVGTRRNGYVEVQQGLQAGDTIVSQGLIKLKAGDAVTIMAIEKPGDTLKSLQQRAGSVQ